MTEFREKRNDRSIHFAKKKKENDYFKRWELFSNEKKNIMKINEVPSKEDRVGCSKYN